MHAVRAGPTYDYHTMSATARCRVESELRSADLAGRFLGEGAESGHARGLNVPTARFRGRVGIVGRNRGDDLGISADDIRQLLAANPRRFLGLPEPVSGS